MSGNLAKTALIIIGFVLGAALGLANAEIGNTLENFHAHSPFTRQFGFMYMDRMELPCLPGPLFGPGGSTELKYSSIYRYRRDALTDNPSQITLRTQRNPRIIGVQTLTLRASRGMNDAQWMFLRTFIEESTRKVLTNKALYPKMVAFVDSSGARFDHTGERRFETAFVEKAFLIELRMHYDLDDVQFIVEIGALDSKRDVPCTVR